MVLINHNVESEDSTSREPPTPRSIIVITFLLFRIYALINFSNKISFEVLIRKK